MPFQNPTDSTTLTPQDFEAPQRRTGALLVAEMRNFVAMADLLPPHEVQAIAARFFDLVAEAAGASGGEAMRAHNGSAMLAFCRLSPPQCARQAVRAAQAIQMRFGALAEEWQSRFGMQSAVSMGLHLGDAVFVRASDMLSAHGDTVSIAEGLANRARTGEYVLSDSVMGALVVANLDLQAEPLPPLLLPRHHDIRIFGVLLDTRLDFTAPPPPAGVGNITKTVPTSLARLA